MNARALPILAAGLALALAGCSKDKTAEAPPPAAAAPAASPTADAVATIDGTPITAKELDEHIGPQMIQLERRQAGEKFELRQRALDNLVMKKLIEAEAARRGVSVDQLIKTEVEDKTPPPSFDELRAFYAQNQEKLRGQPFEAVRPQLAPYLHQQKKQEALVAYVQGLGAAHKVDITLPPPELPRVNVAADGPSRGPAGAPVTMVVFSDFQCPYCSKALPVIDEVARTYGDKVRIVFRDYPLPNHAQAPKAGEAGHCADEQGKFWELHDLMFQNQDKLRPEGLKELARRVPGLDAGRFDACLDGGKMAEKVKKNAQDGANAGVDGTPSFFINGQMVGGAQDVRVFKSLIDRELQRSGA